MSESSAARREIPLETSIPQGGAPLESILFTEELQRRVSRPADYEKENRALVALMAALADSPDSIFQTLAETILDVTECDSAGISLLTRDGKTPAIDGKKFYWPAVAGMWNVYVGSGTPRDFGPCGDVLDQNRTLLFRHFERRYTYLVPLSPAAEECLLVPFCVGGEAVGTIWAIMHTDRRQFDAEDERIMASLGKFASSAYQAVTQIETLKFQGTEREKAEAEVRKLAEGLEAKIRRLFDANVVGIVTWNLAGAITGANDAFLHMVQYDRERLVSGRIRWADLTPVEWRDSDEKALTDLRNSGVFQPYEKEYVRQDGSRVPILLGGALFERTGEEGVAFVLDLTEQKLQESARLYIEERHRVVVETASDAIISIDAAGLIVFANPATSAIFGYDSAELMGKPLTLLMPEYMRELHQTGFARYLATGQRHINWQAAELTALRKNGEEFPVEISFGELAGQGHKIFTGFIRDISKRKQAEQAVQRSEAFLAHGQRLSRMGSYSWRAATNEITWSDELFRIYQLEPPLTPERIRERVHPDDLSLYEKMLEQAQSGGNDFEWQYRLVMPDHSIKYLHAVAHAITDQLGQPEYIAAVQDVTARRLSEEALDRARSELAHVSRVTAMGELSASIAHELNQPLTAVINNANACLRLLANRNLDPGVLQQVLGEIVADGSRASAVVSRIRAFIMKTPAERSKLDINEVIQDVMALARHELQRKQVDAECHLTEKPPLVLADRVQLQQVLLNLIINSIEAMSPVKDRPRLLRVQSKIDDSGNVLVAIGDSGPGFVSEPDRLFTPFFTTKANGLGMGLSISRSLIESHSGRLWATPNSPHGAVFSFTLPTTSQSAS